MSNLLDKSSIVLTPTAYDNGKVLCVKPSDGSGDFDFSRNSAATRVNAQGLVEDVQILSSNLVQNGSFSQLGSEEITNGNFSQQGSELVTNGDFATDTNWTKGTGWSISGGSANCDGTDATSNLNQVITSFSGKTFLVEGNASNVTQGFVYISLGGTDLQIVVNSNGSFKHYVTITSGSSTLFISARNNFIGSIDNVSVVEVGQDWTLGTGWSIGDSVASCDGTQTGGTSLYQSALQQNKSYKITFSITSITAGGVGVVNSPKYTTTGTFTYYYNVTGTDSNLYVNANTDFIGSITNISVKEVGQNWDLGTGWIVDQANSNASSIQTSTNNYLQQTISTLSNNKLYRVLFDLNIISSAVTTIGISNSGAFGQLSSSERFYTTSGTKTFDALYSSSYPNYIRFVGGIGTEFTITNITVIEITDDTNLPRINYEGFSYQDVLGSEEIVNGDFATDSDWVKQTGWSIANGLASCDGSQSLPESVYQNGVTVVGKIYKITYTIVSRTSGSVRALAGTIGGTFQSTPNTYIEYLTATGNVSIGIQANADFVGSIDNVSVKEVLGQEVVPDSGCGSWLWEPQSTNLLPYSNDLNAAGWFSSSAVTISSNFATSPDGTNNAQGWSNSAGAFPQAGKTISGLTIGESYTASFYVKSDGTPQTQLSTQFTGFSRLDFTPTDKWVRITNTIVATATSHVFIVFINSGSAPASTFLLYGFQVENQSYATSYIPTDGTSVTRNQDVCTNGGSAASINSTEGVLYAEIAALADTDTANRTIALSENNTTNRLELRLTLSGTIEARFDSLSSDISLIKTGIDVSNTNKIALFWESGKCALWVNGIKEQENLTFNTFPLNSLFNFSFLSPFAGGSNNFFGKTKCLAVWKEALTDTELQELTTI